MNEQFDRIETCYICGREKAWAFFIQDMNDLDKQYGQYICLECKIAHLQSCLLWAKEEFENYGKNGL